MCFYETRTIAQMWTDESGLWQYILMLSVIGGRDLLVSCRLAHDLRIQINDSFGQSKLYLTCVLFEAQQTGMTCVVQGSL